MAKMVHFLCALAFLCLITQGNCVCDAVSNFIISQSQTGEKVESKTQWKVIIKNDCLCTREEIKLFCKGFQTVEKIDSSILAVNGDECLIKNGGPLRGFESFSFTYAWDSPFGFKAIDSLVQCS